MRALPIMALVGLASLVGAAPAQAETISYTATLSPDEEVPDKGPAGASGTAKVDINTDTNQVCYELTHAGLSEQPSAAHIHSGAKGAAGPIHIDFDVPTNGLKNCVTSEAAKVSAVTANPSAYYVNVHTPSYSAGAIRGQLMAAATTTQPEPSSSLPRTGAPLTVVLIGIGLVGTVLGAALRTAARR